MLIEHLGQRKPGELFVEAAGYRPFPDIHNRTAWQELPERVRAELLRDGEEAMDYGWPSLPATRFLDYKRNGNRTRYQQLYFERRKKLVALVLAECAEDKGRFTDAIVDGVWSLCEESSWALPAHLYLSKTAKDHGLPDPAEPTIDLMAAETAVLAAGIHYMLRGVLDHVSPSVTRRLRHELQVRIFRPYLERTDFFWMGLESDKPVNNWNPWVNSGVLFSFLLIEEDLEVRERALRKIITSLDRFIGSYGDDGGCDEGPAYWDRAAGSLFDCLDMLYTASGGQFDVFGEPLIRQMGLYICKAYIGGQSYMNFADAQPVLAVDGGVLFRYGQRLNDARMMKLGKHAIAYMGEKDILSLHRVVPLLFMSESLASVEGTPELFRDVWMEHIQVMIARETDTCRGLFLAAKGGHNGESHNHNDVGQFIVYCNGLPVWIDIGPETYSAKTFGTQRYEIWTMQSSYHNVPEIRGFQQLDGEEHRADAICYESNDAESTLSLQLEQAYPEGAGLAEWRRSCSLQRKAGGAVVVKDRFRLDTPGEVRMFFMAVCKPELDSGRSWVFQLRDGTEMVMSLETEENVRVQVESIAVLDDRVKASWGDTVYRMVLTADVPASSREWVYTLRRKQEG